MIHKQNAILYPFIYKFCQLHYLINQLLHRQFIIILNEAQDSKLLPFLFININIPLSKFRGCLPTLLPLISYHCNPIPAMSSHKDTQSRSHPRSSQHPTLVYEFLRHNHETKNNQYQIQKLLGEGGFAKCYRTKRIQDQKVFAIKAISLNERSDSSSQEKQKSSKYPRISAESKATFEANFLKVCNHPNIVQYETHFIYNNVFYIVMEFCPNASFGDMLKQRKTITEVEARYYLAQMVNGLMYLRSKKIIHRDLKPANYLLGENMELKIADFGLATEVKNGIPVFSNVCGTPNYLSPEMISKKNYSYQVDVWSLGVVMYAMLYGMPPFQTKKKDAKETYERIKRCDYSLNSSKVKISAQAKDLITKILVLDPSKRISLESILNHPFMSTFIIPREISYKCLKKEPDERYLHYYDFKINQEQRGKPLSTKEKFRYKLSEERPNNRPIRYCPPEFEKQEEQERSFIKCETYHYDRNHQTIKRDFKKIRSQGKFYERKHEQKRPKSIGQVMKKIQKQQMVTSSPITSNSSIKEPNQDKYVQYPSQSLKAEQIDLKKQSLSISNIENDLQTPLEKDNMPSYESIQCESMVQMPFPSFAHLMKPLSYCKQEGYEEYLKTIKMDWRQIQEINLRNNTKDRKSLKISDAKATSKIQLESNKVAGYKRIEQLPFCSLEDFLLYTSSIYTVSSKLFKMVYCIKVQQPPAVQNNLQKPNTINSTRYIGLIFNDNSSIITKLSQLEKDINYSSVYISEIKNVGKHTLKFYEQKVEENGIQNPEDKCVENWIAIKLDFFGKQKVAHSENHRNSLKESFKPNYDLRMKAKLASTAIELFRHTLIKDFPEIFTQNQQDKSFSQTKFKEITPNINEFQFINMFRSRQQSLYFELNDGSKHILEKVPRKETYQNLFRSSILTNVSSYKYAIYFSNKKAAYLKQPEENEFRTLITTEINSAAHQAKLVPVKKQPYVKVLQEEPDEVAIDKIKKKVKLTEDTSKSSNKRMSKALPHKENMQENHLQSRNSTMNNIFQKLCQQLQSKIGMNHIRERDFIKNKRKQSGIKERGESRANKDTELRENRFYRWEIKEGRLDFKLKKFDDLREFLKKKQ